MERVDKLSNQYLAPSLKANGFIKQRFKWKRERNGFIDTIQLLSSQWNSENNESFSINYGICIPDFSLLIWGKELDKFPAPEDGVFNSFLTGNFNLEKDADIEICGKEINEKITKELIPNLESYCDLSDLYMYLHKNEVLNKSYPLDIIYLALLANAIGKKDETKEIFNQLSSTANSAWVERIKIVENNLSS